MKEAPRKVLVIGMPQTGKTTFLAALWDVVGSGEVVDSLQLVSLEGDRHHLNEIRDQWADCLPLERTKVKDEKPVSMRLKDARSGTLHEVTFADMSGESCERQWTERVASKLYIDLVREANGTLLFIHPRRVKAPVLIRDAERIVQRITERSGQAGNVEQGTATAPVAVHANPMPAEPRYAGTQVQLVELLQVMREHTSNQKPFNLGIVVSAWDTLPAANAPMPEEWIARHLPLLHQYVNANDDFFAAKYFGISAQGGDYAQSDALRHMSHKPSDRIVVVDSAGTSHDITRPVRWVLGLFE